MNDTEIYEAIGRFVVAFQMLENELGEIIWFCTDSSLSKQSGGKREARISEQTFGRLLGLAERVARPHFREAGSEQLARFDSAVRRCSDLSARRNGIIHAAYLHVETLEGDVAFVRRRTPRELAGESRLPYENLNVGSFDTALAEIAAVHGELFALHRGLMYSYNPRVS